MMIRILFNNEYISIEKSHSLTDILLRQGYVDNYFAVAINKKFVPRNRYSDQFLQDGDVIDIISPMQGG